MKHFNKILSLVLVALVVTAMFSPAQAQKRKNTPKSSTTKQVKTTSTVEQQPQVNAQPKQDVKKSPREYFDELKEKRYDLFEKSQLFYLDKVKPIFDELETIPEETSPEDVEKMQQELKTAQNKLAVIMPSQEQFDNEISSFVTSLLASRCNPQAIALVKDLSSDRLAYQLGQLKNFEYYSTNMRSPLENVRTALEKNGWKKLKDGSTELRVFDKEWENTLYLNSLTNSTGNGIPFLNDQMRKVMTLRMKGFDNCQSDLKQVIENLTPSEDAGWQQIADDASRYGEIIKTQNKISSIEHQLRTISDENAKFNELDKQRYEVVEKWYDQREEIDKLLLDACKYCLSYPCDNLGIFKYMREQVEPMLSSVYHKSYKARRDTYVTLFDNYDSFTSELETFLKQIYPYVRTTGALTSEDKDVILSSLHSLDYYSNYYVHRNENKAVSIPYLDSAIGEIEKMISNNFAGALEKYNLLSENLRVPVFEKIDSRTFTVKGISFTMVGVQGGTFTMGATPEQGGDVDSDEKPAHQVIVSSFAIGQTEVTQELWEAVMGSNPSYWKGSKLPVEQVSWNDCQEFVKKLNALTGQNFRLPTEAEWEYAARGGSKSRGYKYSGSNNVDDVAWYDGNSGRKTHDVATKLPNELGLYDMSGNVWEWCQDWYGNYTEGAQMDPAGPASGSYRVNRGGGWDSGARNCRVAYRNRRSADCRGDYLGLRLAL